MRQWAEVVAISLMCAVWMGCAGDSGPTAKNASNDKALRTPASLMELGPYTIGVKKTTITYQAPGLDAPRELPVIVWYPSEEAPDHPPNDGIGLLSGLMALPTRGYANLALAKGGSFPFAIYSHGSGGEASLAYPYGEEFASRGWIVASVSHVGNTTRDSLDNPLDVPMYIPIVRMLDISHVIDSADTGFEFDGFAGKINTDDVFVFGHSLGAYTALALGGAQFQLDGARALVCEDSTQECDSDDIVCGDYNPVACDYLHNADVEAAVHAGFRDERVKAIGLQAPGEVGMIDASAVEVPALMLTGDQDGWLPKDTEQIPVWNGLHNPGDLWLQFANAGHLSFITMCSPNVLGPAVVNQFLPVVGNDGCDNAYIDPEKMANINAAYLMAFAEKHILGVHAWDADLNGSQSLPALDGVGVTIVTHDD